MLQTFLENINFGSKVHMINMRSVKILPGKRPMEHRATVVVLIQLLRHASTVLNFVLMVHEVCLGLLVVGTCWLELDQALI